MTWGIPHVVSLPLYSRFSRHSTPMLLCIDFQPAYAEAFLPSMKPLRSRLSRAAREREEVHFIYNEAYSLEGEELGDPIERVLSWSRKARLSIGSVLMIRKNFGWVSHLFRNGYERSVAVSILRYLMEHNLSSSAEMPRSELERIVSSSHEDFEGFWDCSPEAWEEILSGAIAMPYLFEGGALPWLESLRSRKGEAVEVTGGFRHRCLDEMCMLLEAGDIPYRLNESLIYGLKENAPEDLEEILGLEVPHALSPLLIPDSDMVEPGMLSV